MEQQAAIGAAKLRLWAISSLQERMENGTLALEDVLKPEALRLFRDSEDRAHGTPRQSIEHGGEGGGPLQVLIQRYTGDAEG